MESQGLDLCPVAKNLTSLAACLSYPSEAMAEEIKIDFLELSGEYIRLFVNNLGGVKAAPYAGCYISSEERRHFMIDFNGFCLDQGISLCNSQPPDFIPSMLEALALLLRKEDFASESESIIDKYYSQWPEGFAEALNKNDTTGFYASVGEELVNSIRSLTTLNNKQV